MNKSGEREEYFRLLYNDYYPTVLRICRGYVNGNIEAAKDLTQDVFSRVWENLDSFNDHSKISTWIYRIAVNTSLLQIRKSKTEVKAYDLKINSDNDYNELYEFRMKKLMNAINTLSPQNKSIILLELESLPQKEIADIIGISHSAVRVRISRIKETLSKIVKR